MPRLRSRRTTKENIDGPEETKSPKIRGTAGSRVVAAKKKGNDDTLIAVNALAMLKSPVLRDRTNLITTPTKNDVLKKGIEDKEAGDQVAAKSEVKATKARQKKIEEVKDVKTAVGRTRTRGSKADIQEIVSLKPSTSGKKSNMIITDGQDDVAVKAVENKTAKSKNIAGKKLPMGKRTRLVEQKLKSKVSTRAKKVGAAKDKLKPLKNDSDDESKDVEENLPSNEADDELNDSLPENNDNPPKVVKKKSADKKKVSVTSNKRSLRARKTEEINDEKSADEDDNDHSEDVQKQPAHKKKASVTLKTRTSRARMTKEVNKSKDDEKKSAGEDDNDQSEDSSPETADNKAEDVKKQSADKKKASVTFKTRTSRARKTKEMNKSKGKEKLANEADNDHSEDSSPETDELETQKTDKPTGKKFFKTIVPTAHYKLSPVKKKRLAAKQKNVWGQKVRGKVADPRMSASFRLRQMTLKESLANISKKALRARPAQKKSNENSPSKKIVKKRGPVYKEILEDGVSKKNSPDEIYEFSYDLNDSKERKIVRKRKITRKAPVKRNKAATKTKKTVNKTEEPSAVTTEKIVKNKAVVPAGISEEPAETNQVNITVAAEVYDPPSPEPFFEDEQPKKSRPVMISCQELSAENRINWTTTPVQPKPTEKESSGPRQFSQRPSKQMKTMLDTSLIRRSLSPISKANPNPFIEDAGSPWRLIPPSNSFSRVKNVFQSTPQGKKFTTLLGKASAAENKRLSSNMDKIEEAKDENPDAKLNTSSEDVRINNSKSPRKFGTEISNINNFKGINQAGISPTKSPRMFGTDLSNSNNSSPAKSPLKKKLSNSLSATSPLKKKLSNSSLTTSPMKKKLSKSLVLNENRSASREKLSVTNASIIGRELSVQNASADETLDKENSAPNLQSPSKTPRKNSRSFGSSFGSPFKGFPSNKPVENSSLGSPFKGFPSEPPASAVIEIRQDSTLEDSFKGFPSNKPVEDSTLGSPFKGFPSEPSASAATKTGQKLPPEIETKPETESRPEIETQPAIELQSDIEPQPDFEPQPGPSGLQKNSPPAKTWNLKQSNLNRFLNLPEKPTSTRISTAHGIFDDLNTSPIEVNVKKTTDKTGEANIENAFGFDDNDESDEANISYDFNKVAVEPTVPKKVPAVNATNVKTVKPVIHNNNDGESKTATRIPTAAINRILRSNKQDDEVKEPEIQAAPLAGEHPFAEPAVVPVEPEKFLDTFDLSTADTENVDKPIGLFLDSEPVIHYKEPPRFSYKRKRRQRLMSCGDSEEESDDEERKRPIKKKKLTKAEREQNKQIDEWAKMINNSFAEIDHFNLVVE